MEQTRITAEDYLSLRFVEDIQTSENFVIWVNRKPDPLDRNYKSYLQFLEKRTGKITQFTSGNNKDYYPRISPDETQLAFISTRNTKPQLFVMSLNGGEALPITSGNQFENGIGHFSWSPDSRSIVFGSKMEISSKQQTQNPPQSQYEKELRKLDKEEKERRKNDPKVIKDLVYRSGTSYLNDDLFSHLFLYSQDTKEIKQLTFGEYSFSEAAWFDTSTIYSITCREKPKELGQQLTLVKISTDGSEKDVHSFTHPMNLFLLGPKISENGDILINVMDPQLGFQGQNTQWAIYKDGKHEIINKELDRSINNFHWIDNRQGLAMVDHHGKADIRLYDSKSGTFSIIVDSSSSITSFDGMNTSEIYFTATDPKRPFAVWKWTSTDGIQLIYDPNQEVLQQKIIIEPEEFWLENQDGIRYQGWFFDAGMQNGQKPALCLSIHGGPHVMWNNAGTMWHEWQVFLSKGYSILAMNPIGSSGYGEKFSQLITSKWGIDDARDLLAGVDQFIDKVDKNRLYITGGSYAGFQTANIITRDHRFKAACAQRGVFDLVTFWSTTDIPVWATFEWEGEVWDRLNHLWDHSPVGRAREIQTPLMIIHSENDFRVSISQGEELFAALKLQNKEAVIVRYPRDGHELSRSGEPLHVIDRINRMVQWFEDHK